MWLPWSKSITIALGVDGIAICSEGSPPQVLHASDGWFQSAKDVVEALKGLQTEHAHVAVKYIVSNHFVRYSVLPWQPDINSRQDWIALAMHDFRKRYGSIADQWDVRVDLAGYGKSVLACGMDKTLIEAMQAKGQERNWKVKSIEPLLMSLMRSLSLDRPNDWLLIGEPSRIVLCEFVNNQWANFSVINPPPGQEVAQASQLISRASRQAENAKIPKHVHACLAPQLKGEWRFDDIQGISPIMIKAVNVGKLHHPSTTALWMANL